MSYEKVKFSDLYAIPSKNGLTRPKSVRGHGYKMVNMGELFSNDRLWAIPMELVPMKESEKVKNNIEVGDLLFARQSLVLEGAGKCSLVMEVNEYTTFESHLIRVRLDLGKAVPAYYYYYFKSSFSPIRTIVQQCAQAGIRGSDLAELFVDYPAIKIQKRIADILSSYDDLIENNQKQIKLLEEAAMRLYKEWFINLRFPGHEDVKIVDDVPEGWEVFRFSEKVDIMSGGTPKTSRSEFYGGNIPFYTPKDSDRMYFALDTITHITEKGLNNCNSKLYPEGTVIITARGTVGKTVMLAKPMAMNQSCYALKCDELDSPYYLFFSLNKEVEKLKTMANGGVFDTIIVKTFDNIHIDYPPKDIIRAFNEMAFPIMQSIKNKMVQVENLRQARDMLLPKLMSGEIEV